MPTILAPPSALRLARLRAGVALTLMSKALGISVSTLSLIERRLITRPAIEKRMREFLAAHAAAQQ